MECLRALRRPRMPSDSAHTATVTASVNRDAYPDIPDRPAPASRWSSLPSGEYLQMSKMVSSLDEDLRSRLVSHRGFHDAEGTLKERPIENTTAAYREAFSAGMPLAECDITLTSDHHLILCHDSTLRRLAEDLGDPLVDGAVTSLTLAELAAVALKRQERVALLDAVLEETEYHGGRLVIEVKTGADGEKISDALCGYFRKCPQRIKSTAVVMSFDFDIITRFARRFRADRAAAHASEQLQPHELPKLLLLVRNQKNKPRDGRQRQEHLQRRSRVYWEVEWNDGGTATAQRLRSYVARAEQTGAPLDGLYIQMHRRMLVDEDCAEAMREFAKAHVLGVWGGKGDADDVDTCRRLIALGAHFVNTDLPLDFADIERSPYLDRNGSVGDGDPAQDDDDDDDDDDEEEEDESLASGAGSS